MTKEAFVASLIKAYEQIKKDYYALMFPEGAARGWTMSEIDQMDVHFFDELLKDRSESPQETEQYLSEVW